MAVSKSVFASSRSGYLLAFIVSVYLMNLFMIIVYVDFMDSSSNTNNDSSSSLGLGLLSLGGGGGRGGGGWAASSSTSNFDRPSYCPRNTTTTSSSFSNKKQNYHPTILWGIPTYDNDVEESQRRQMIRETYLSFYSKSEETPNRICSLQNYTCLDSQQRVECQIIYTFFMGGNPNGPTELLDEDLDDFRSMVTTSNQVKVSTRDKLANDITYLNIQENQFDGKMTTWFKFGSLVGKEFASHIEYVAKADSDTIVFVPNFLEYMKERLPPRGRTRLSYAGRANTKDDCDHNLTNHDHACPMPLVGSIYMTGDLNMMSVDLAEYISSPDCPRSKVTIATHEDVSIGNYVFSHPKSSEITTVIVPRKRLLLTPNFDMNFGQVDLKQDYANYTYYLWGHSKRQRNFEYFKNLRNYGRMWKRFHRQFKYTADYSTTYLPKKVKQE